MAMGACPECGGEVQFVSQPRLGQRAECPDCEAVLEVVAVSPIELDWAFEEPFQTPWRMEEVVR
jgi:lysine biosynthesis protein LysW